MRKWPAGTRNRGSGFSVRSRLAATRRGALGFLGASLTILLTVVARGQELPQIDEGGGERVERTRQAAAVPRRRELVMLYLFVTSYMLGVVAFFFATTALSARIKIDAEAKRERAVIVAKEIAVFASPTSDATLEFRVHEGTRVIAEKSRSNWVKIRLPGGLDGWVDSAAIERI